MRNSDYLGYTSLQDASDALAEEQAFNRYLENLWRGKQNIPKEKQNEGRMPTDIESPSHN